MELSARLQPCYTARRLDTAVDGIGPEVRNSPREPSSVSLWQYGYPRRPFIDFFGQNDSKVIPERADILNSDAVADAALQLQTTQR